VVAGREGPSCTPLLTFHARFYFRPFENKATSEVIDEFRLNCGKQADDAVGAPPPAAPGAINLILPFRPLQDADR
jgi:hypothetical protein